MLRKVEECTLCHSKENEWENVFALNEDQDLVRCRKCGLVFNNFQRTDFDSIYSNTYFDKDEQVISGGGFHNYSALEKGIQKMYGFAYSFIKSKSRPDTDFTVLDIGCSFGFFLTMFKNDQNFRVLGVELNKKAVEEAKKKGIKIYMIPFEEMAEDEKFDYISFFELIEHTLYPAEVMKKINTLLLPGGYAILSTPDIDSISFKILKKKWPSIHPAVHNNYFDQSTIRFLSNISGFEVISIHKSHFMWSDFFHFRKRLSEMFPVLQKLLKVTSFMDPLILPFFNGGDLRVILKKKK